MQKRDIHKRGTFLYFAYSANLLRFRMKWINPSAQFVSIGRLDVSKQALYIPNDNLLKCND